MAELLEMRGITIQFPGVKALDGVDFTLKTGEIHSLLGENGAGKSTLIKCLTGVNRMDGGSIRLDGEEIRPASPQQAIELGISTVFQEVNLCPNLTVAENIFVGRQPMRHGQIDWRTINRRAAELMARFHLNIDVTRPLSYYSTAIQQMTSIARAVDVKAKILILDEPTSSLDENEVQLLFSVMHELKAQGMGIIFITHFLDQIYAVSDRMTILRNGHLVGTWGVSDLSKVDLVTKMVGKDMDVIFNLKRANVEQDAPIMLKAEHIGDSEHIRDISVNLKKGELIGFAGLLGSGRTETAEILFGASRATKGNISIDDEAVTLRQPFDAIKAQIAFCPEDRKRDGLIGDLSIRENIMLAVQSRQGFMHPMSRQEQTDLANKYIKMLGIATPDCEKKAGELSGGNQQKVILARWMATQPKVLILDEPTRGIDIGAKAEIQRLMLEMCGDGVSVIFISSELDEIIRCSNRVVVMRDREKVAEVDGAACTQQDILKIIAEGAQSLSQGGAA
ncbi:MAG: sugar ABC transporter ATP-binding protein [Fretibacterium sp.]|nr:sugar ABC transporter ATP-binding protein [Fretibacterium sp.]